MLKLLFLLSAVLAVSGKHLGVDKGKTEDEFDTGIAETQAILPPADKEIEEELDQKEELSEDDNYYIDPFPYIAVSFITSSTRLHIERMMWNGEINHAEKIVAEQELNRCVEYMKTDGSALSLFMNWENLGEFMEWQVTKAMARNGRYISGHRLIPLRFRKFLKYIPTEANNLMDIDTFKYQQYAIFLIVDQVCGGGYEFQTKLGEVIGTITHQDIRNFFYSLEIESYVSDLETAHEKTVDEDWKCYDDQIVLIGGERNVVGKIRDWVFYKGITGCDVPVILFSESVSSSAPSSDIQDGEGEAPNSNTGGLLGGAPRGK